MPWYTPGLLITAFSSDRKSTRLNSSHTVISYAVFCLKKKNLRLAERHGFPSIGVPRPNHDARPPPKRLPHHQGREVAERTARPFDSRFQVPLPSKTLP